jgi:class 3 adenylate cyclase
LGIYTVSVEFGARSRFALVSPIRRMVVHNRTVNVETQFARTADGKHVAYQVTGRGPLDIVFLRGWIGDIESEWDEPVLARMLRRFESMGRLIRLDRRGMGLSDRITLGPPPTLEERIDDIRAVMDSADSKRAAFITLGHGGSVAAVFAATHPERTLGLVLWHPLARGKWAPDFPWLTRDEDFPRLMDALLTGWGTRDYSRRWASVSAPSRVGDAGFIEWLTDQQRRAGTVDDGLAVVRMERDTDIRDALPAVHVPTLILTREPSIDRSRYFADRVPGARMVVVAGEEEMALAGDTDSILREIAAFIDELRSSPAGADIDRVLATLLFTDIVGSTARAADLGDKAWADLLERHLHRAQAIVHAFRGRIVDTAGDGVFASFDGTGRAMRCASALVEDVVDLGLEIRAGLHTGECEVAGDRLRGVAVHVGARVAAMAGPSEVLVTGTVKDLVAGAGFSFVDRGLHRLKGVEGKWRLYAVG